MAAGPSDFNATTTADLVALCSDRPGDPLYAEAMQFCYGFVAGVAQLHRSMVDGESLEPLACPEREVTREQLVEVFLDWAKANPRSMAALPVESLIQAAGARWPCSSGSAGTGGPAVAGDR
jgi:hypothetical protein